MRRGNLRGQGSPGVNPMRCIGNNDGIVYVLIAMSMLVIIGLVGLAIDLGYLYEVKAQLQNAADAGALAGAKAIYHANTISYPDLDAAVTRTHAFAKVNRVAGATLTDADIESIQSGNWDLSQNPPALTTTGVPGVQLTVRKTVPTFFAKALGFNAFSPKATALAVAKYAEKMQNVFPFAVKESVVDNFFRQNPPPSMLDLDRYSGKWTSHTSDGNDGTPTVRDLIDNQPRLGIGDVIYLDHGTRGTLYQEAQDYTKVLLPVIADADFASKAGARIVGFVNFHINSVPGNDNKLEGRFEAVQIPTQLVR